MGTVAVEIAATVAIVTVAPVNQINSKLTQQERTKQFPSTYAITE